MSPPVQTALVVGGVVAVVAAVVGVFVIVRGQSFAAHSLADLGAVGGSASYLLGISQLWGFVGAGVFAAVAMETIGIQRIRSRDVATGVVLGAGLGLTSLFLYLSATQGTGSSHDATVSVLFGSLFVIDPSVVPAVCALALVAAVLIVGLYRWLQVEMLDPDLATAAGIPVRAAGIALMVAVALAVELSCLTIGVILSTALVIGPSAAAMLVTRRIGATICVAVTVGVCATWGGCFLSYESHRWVADGRNWPVSFCIVALVVCVYVVARLGMPVSRRLRAAVG